MNSGSGDFPRGVRSPAVATGLATDGGGCSDPRSSVSPAPDARKLPAAIGYQLTSDETRFDMTEIRDLQFGIHVSADAPTREEWLAEHNRLFPDVEQANADFYYQLGNTTQLEAVGEDTLDAHMSDPIFAELQRESLHYLQDDEVNLDPDLSNWDRAEDASAFIAWATMLMLGGVLGVIGWLALVTA